MNLRLTPAALIACASMLLFASCKKDQGIENFTPSAFSVKNNPDVVFYALANGTTLDKYNATSPETILNTAVIMGLQPGETILSIDFRPATGQLYGLGSTSRLYIINPETGAARMVGTAPLTTAIVGTTTGFDFNPTVDRIRIVTSSGQNFRVNPETGAVVMPLDGNINGTTGAMIAAVAYTNNFAGAATTTLYDIDVTTQTLYKQIPPNNGTLVEVGPLQLKVTGEGGFDISPDGIVLGLFEVNKKATLFTVDTVTGRATKVTKFEKDINYTAIAIQTRPVAYAISGANLLILNPTNTSNVVSKTFTGLQTGESLLGLDFRPANGQLYALGSTGTVYTINASSGAATTLYVVPISGTSFGFDFNPAADRIRIISNTGQNLRIVPADGTVTTDGSINPVGLSVSAAAYSNNFAGTTSTMLFDIDANADKLYLQSPPNSGTLTEIGNLGINVDASNGFDIGGNSGIAYGIFTVSGSTGLYKINLATGAATALGNISAGVTGFTIGLGF